jgi:hypothetical protein
VLIIAHLVSRPLSVKYLPCVRILTSCHLNSVGSNSVGSNSCATLTTEATRIDIMEKIENPIRTSIVIIFAVNDGFLSDGYSGARVRLNRPRYEGDSF